MSSSSVVRRAMFGAFLVGATACTAVFGVDFDNARPRIGGGPGSPTDGDGGDACRMACQSPPPSVCIDGKRLRAHAPRGCGTDGVCTYAPFDVLCTSSCEAGACKGDDPCNGVACVTPSPPVCVDGATLETSSTGTCSNGRCEYASTRTHCAAQCTAGTCAGEPCAGVSCNTAPPSSCPNTATRRSYAPTGTCSGEGVCSYAKTDTSCSSAPTNADPVCIGGKCDFACRPGFSRMGATCVADLQVVCRSPAPAGLNCGAVCQNAGKTCTPTCVNPYNGLLGAGITYSREDCSFNYANGRISDCGGAYPAEASISCCCQ